MRDSSSAILPLINRSGVCNSLKSPNLRLHNRLAYFSDTISTLLPQFQLVSLQIQNPSHTTISSPNSFSGFRSLQTVFRVGVVVLFQFAGLFFHLIENPFCISSVDFEEGGLARLYYETAAV
ncbi:hypothetical protein AAHA92_10933 [Salvia divinorum]|uniref:Uncharacterized protein n=1 Tax=Salvia divinorum TaxID=28513 RepID=A0ABD1HWD3_SALDI